MKCFFCYSGFFFIKQNIDRVVNTLYQFMDPENKGKSALILIQQMLDYEINAIYTICMFIQVVVLVCCSSS